SFPIGFQKLDTISGQLLAQGVEKFTSKDEDCYEKPAIDVVLGRDSGDLFFLVSDDADKQASYAEVQVWETNSFQCKKTLLRIEGHARSLTSDSNGNLIAVNVSEGISDYRSDEATDKGFTVIWNIESDSLICRIPDGPSIFIPGSTDLIVFQSGVDDTNKWINQLTIWDSQNCQPLVEVANILPSYNFLPALSITSDGKILAIAQRDIKLIDVSNGKLLAEIKDPSPKASDLEQTDNILFFSPDGNFLVYVTPRGVGESIVNLWHIERVN
ncbi:MAG TPA: hypothetical protein VK851_02655, partial [Anaerolineales bacterium]|nr:hypothetical protein [Anaerolineales bacterium]